MLIVQILADARINCETRKICSRSKKLNYLEICDICQLLDTSVSTDDFTQVSIILQYFSTKFAWSRFCMNQILTCGYFRWVVEEQKIKLLRLLIAKQYLALLDIQCYLFTHACSNGCLKIVKLFLEHGCTIDDIRASDNYALNAAIMGNHLSVVKLLVRCGLTANDLRSKGNYALLIASIHGHLKIVKFLIRHGLNLGDIRSQNNFIVNKTNERGQLDVLQFFIKKGLHPGEISPTFHQINAKLDIVLSNLDKHMATFDTIFKSMDKTTTKIDAMLKTLDNNKTKN